MLPQKKKFTVYYKQDGDEIKTGYVEFEVVPGEKIRIQIQKAFEENYGETVELLSSLDLDGINAAE